MDINPLVPDNVSIFFFLLSLLTLALWAAGAITLFRARARVSPGELMFWVAVIILAPVLGSAAWLFFRVLPGRGALGTPE